jgi:hypothetical protein
MVIERCGLVYVKGFSLDGKVAVYSIDAIHSVSVWGEIYLRVRDVARS